MRVNELLKHKLTETNANFVHADNDIEEVYGAGEWVAFRCACGLLWMDHPDLAEPYCSAYDEHPSSETPVILNEATGAWLWLIDEKGEWYRLENAEGDEAFVLVSASMQHSPRERELTVVGETPSGEWFVADPTPHSPRAVLLCGVVVEHA